MRLPDGASADQSAIFLHNLALELARLLARDLARQHKGTRNQEREKPMEER